MIEKGKLYIVSTPIGNLSDMTFRAIETLKSVDLIAAEDTRHTLMLLNHFDIKVKTTSYHEHNKYEKAEVLIKLINEGKNVALVTDAGTPIISDPGDILVKRAIEDGIMITAIPGACAAINALVLSGLDASSFVFVGFLPDDNKKRNETISNLRLEQRTMIFYISPHNLKDDIQCIVDVLGEEREASISREMTKKYEEIIRGSLIDIKWHFDTTEPKGEFVLVVAGLPKEVAKKNDVDRWSHITIKEQVALYIESGLSEREAMKKVATVRGIDKRIVYKEYKIGGDVCQY